VFLSDACFYYCKEVLYLWISVQFCDGSLITMRIFSNKIISGKVCRRKLSEIIGVSKQNSFRLQVLRKTAQLKQIIFGRRFQTKDFRVGAC